MATNGSIKYLGKGRRNPYAVHPPTTEFTLNGVPKTPKAICYVSDWMVGFAVLTAYRAGTYYPGYEKTVAATADISGSKLIQSILADYNLTKASDEKLEAAKKTFSDVYEEFYQWKYERDQSRKLSESSKNSTRAAYKNCSAIHDKVFADLRHQDLQNIIDSCPLKHASKELIVSLMHQMYAYAEIYELCDKDYSVHVRINTEDDDEHGVPFTDDEMKILWENKENDVIQMLLIMCYSGFRITEYSKITINQETVTYKIIKMVKIIDLIMAIMVIIEITVIITDLTEIIAITTALIETIIVTIMDSTEITMEVSIEDH